MSDEGSLEVVRCAAPRTIAQGSARVRLTASGELPGDEEEVVQEGVIDFTAAATALGESVEIGGQRWFLHDGQWRGPVGQPDDPLTAGSPLWLVEITRGAAAATPIPSAGAQGRSFQAMFDLVAAAEASPWSLASPGGFSLTGLRRCEGAVRISADGALAAVELRLEGKTTTTLELDDLGVPVTVVAPV